MRLKANKLIMADFCLLFGTLSFFLIVIRFFCSAVSGALCIDGHLYFS